MFPRLAAFISALLVSSLAPTLRAEPMTAGAILQDLRNFRETGSVLFIAAHPDDENNRLLPCLARGRALRTGYLSLTRGDGGQNLIGPELGEKLGVIRTQELLAARRIDGAQQYFTRARDFGFSKTPEEALRIWDRDQVLADIVRVIRQFRPDVIVTRFPIPPGSGGHGHHTASAILALEAFKLSGDPAAYPEQLREGLAPWQAKRILWNSFNPANFGSDPKPGALCLEANGYDPLLGESFSEIGARARTMHKSQGEGRSGARGSIVDTFQLLAGEPAAKNLLDGVDTSWARFPGGAEIGPLASDLIAKFNPLDPAASVPALLALRARLATLAPDPLLPEKRAQLDRILQACLGLFVETTLPAAQVVPGETLKLKHSATVRTGFPVRWVGVRYTGAKSEPFSAPVDLKPDSIASREAAPGLSIETPLTQPYWLRETGTAGMFRVDDSSLIGRAENPPAFPVEQIFEVGGQTLVVADEPVQITTDPVRGELRRPLEVIAPVALNWVQPLELFAPAATKTVALELTAARVGTAGTLRPEVPAGWQVSPATQDFTLAAVGAKARFNFTVTAPAAAASAQLRVRAEIGGRRYHRSLVEIAYDHIPAQILQDSAELKLLTVEVATKARRIGYLSGAGDDIPAALVQLGCTVVTLTGEDLTPEKLAGLDAVVFGVRAFNIRTDLVQRLPALWAWVESGGTVIVQYSRPGRDLKTDAPAPFPLKLSNLRITDEDAAMTFLAPDHPALNAPNKITAADFTGWVQERGSYFAETWDARFTPLLAGNDPGESPLKGGLLIARHGKGHYVYAGLTFFRQLPAGVPGAYRLFANLLSLGHE